MVSSSRIKTKIRKLPPLGRAIRIVWESGPAWFVASVILLVVRGVLPLVSLYLMKLMVDAVAAGVASTNKDAAFRDVALLVAVAGGVALFSSIIDLISGLVGEEQGQSVVDHMNHVLHTKAIDADLEYHENPTYHDTLHRAHQDGPSRPLSIVRGLLQLGQSAISLIAIGGLIVTLHPGIALLLLVTAIPGVFVRAKYANEVYDWQRSMTVSERQSSYYSMLLTADWSAKEIRIFNLGPTIMDRFKEVRRYIRQGRLKIAIRRTLRDLITQTMAIAPMFVSYAFVAYQTVNGSLTLGSLVMYFQAFQRGQGFLLSLLNGIIGLYQDSLFLNNLYDFLDLKPKLQEPVDPKPVPRPMRQGISFNNVSFSYLLSSRKAVQEVNLTIRPGEVVAIVGENGSGKTTLVKLLCRLYDPASGNITLDGADIREFSKTALRREISVIFQDFMRYHMTARENIWLGDVELSPDSERVDTAAKLSGADEVISTLKNGYQTQLGKYFDEGEDLSIGQWQKVAIARAFVRDTQLIILDEPTSALDPKAEAEVFEKFRSLIKDQAAILISHRLSTVKMADRIYVMSDGTVVESGTHDELMSKSGAYARLFEIQAQPYR